MDTGVFLSEMWARAVWGWWLEQCSAKNPTPVWQHVAHSPHAPGAPGRRVYSQLCSLLSTAVLRDPTSIKLSPCSYPTYHGQAALCSSRHWCSSCSRAPHSLPYIAFQQLILAPHTNTLSYDCTRASLASFIIGPFQGPSSSTDNPSY